MGDSYSQDLYNAIREVGIDRRIDLIVRYMPVKCGTLFIEKSEILQIASLKDREFCNRRKSLIEDDELKELLQTADFVFLASSWRDEHVDHLNSSIKNLKDLTEAHIVIFGKKTLIPLVLGHAFLPVEERVSFTVNIAEKLVIQKKMISTEMDATYFDTQSIICDVDIIKNYDLCSPFDENGMPKSYDGGHLTKHGAIYLGERLNRKLSCILFGECE